MLDDLIDVLRTPFQAVVQRRPQASRDVYARRRFTEIVHSVGRSPRSEPESGAALVTLNAWLARADGSSADDDAEVLKAKLDAQAATGPREPDERTPVEDVDLLKAKLLHREPAKPEKAGRTSDKALAAKLRTESDADKYRVAPRRKPAPPISAEDRERDAPSLLIIPSASSGAKTDRPRRRADDACTLRYWRGYVKSRFYAADDAGHVIAGSRLFRSRGADGAESNDAVAAHRELVAQLEDEGWVPAGKGDLWHELRFRRTAVPAGRPSPTTRPEREEHHV